MVDPERLSLIQDLLGYPGREDVRLQLYYMILALDIYADRNTRYRDNWRRMGWRGVLIRIRERTERLWDEYWDHDGRHVYIDDALDLVNFAVFFCRGAQSGETTHGGSWWD